MTPPPLIELHTVWSGFPNFFLPTRKLIRKERVAGKIHTTDESRARTPCVRLLEGQHPAGAARIALIGRRSLLDQQQMSPRLRAL